MVSFHRANGVCNHTVDMVWDARDLMMFIEPSKPRSLPVSSMQVMAESTALTDTNNETSFSCCLIRTMRSRQGNAPICFPWRPRLPLICMRLASSVKSANRTGTWPSIQSPTEVVARTHVQITILVSSSTSATLACSLNCVTCCGWRMVFCSTSSHDVWWDGAL